MIENDEQFEVVSRQLQELKSQRDHLLQNGAEPFQTHVEVAGIEKMIVRLEEEISAYQKLKSEYARA